MIATWMVYAVVLTALTGLAALLVERAGRLLGLPTRGIWLAAMGTSIAWPVFAWIRRQFAPLPDPVAISTQPMGSVDLGFSQALFTAPDVITPVWQVLNVPLLAGWTGITVAFVAVLIATHLRLARETRRWPLETLHAVPVRLSPSTGPAVVGWIHSTIVLPDWIRDLKSEWQRLVVMHEAEHQRARDAQTLLAGLVLLGLMLWNPALWWQFRRLREAIELDCDRRLLRSGIDPRSYGSLLLEVTARRVAPTFAAVALSNPRSLLARRIFMMTDRLPRARGLKAALAASAAVALVALGCETPIPAAVDIDPETGAVAGLQHAIHIEEVDVPPERLSGPVPQYPEMLRTAGVEGHVRFSFVIDETGSVDTTSFEIVETTHEAFVGPARSVLANSHYTPAQRDGEAVPVAVEQRVDFHIASEKELLFGAERAVSATKALIVIDGVIIPDSRILGEIDPVTIDRIEVMRGNAAAAIYGERAADGVVHITTKKELAERRINERR